MVMEVLAPLTLVVVEVVVNIMVMVLVVDLAS